MNAFIVFDSILNEKVKNHLFSNSSAAPVSALQKQNTNIGVETFDFKENTVIIINPKKFSRKALSEALKSIHQADTLSVIAPSMIHYFASKMKASHNIFKAINSLSAYSVIVQSAPIFRMDKWTGNKAENDFMHYVSYASFPSSNTKPKTNYITEGGLIRGAFNAKELSGVSSTSLPLVFYHAGLSQQNITNTNNNIVVDSSEYEYFEYNRLALTELMLRFPSQDLKSNEIDGLKRKFNSENIDISKIIRHNKAQWKVVEEKLDLIGFPIPNPTEDETSLEFNQYTHMVMSGFPDIADRLGVELPEKKQHIGIPLFARNNITTPLGIKGIIGRLENVTDEFQQQIDRHLTNIFSMKKCNENTADRLKPTL